MTFIEDRDLAIRTISTRDEVRARRFLTVDELRTELASLGHTGVCLWCGGALIGQQKTMCGKDCWVDYFETTHLEVIRYVLLRERGAKCEKCGSTIIIDTRFEIHHKKPISKGGSLLDRANLIILCEKCHFKAHKKFKAVARRSRDLLQPLEKFM